MNACQTIRISVGMGPCDKRPRDISTQRRNLVADNLIKASQAISQDVPVDVAHSSSLDRNAITDSKKTRCEMHSRVLGMEVWLTTDSTRINGDPSGP
jgi:hypothetical protein